MLVSFNDDNDWFECILHTVQAIVMAFLLNDFKGYSLWSEIIATLLSVTGGNFSAIHVDYVDFVPESGRRFRSRNL